MKRQEHQFVDLVDRFVTDFVGIIRNHVQQAVRRALDERGIAVRKGSRRPLQRSARRQPKRSEHAAKKPGKRRPEQLTLF